MNENIETKAVLTPKAVVDLLFRIKAGEFIESDKELQDLLSNLDYPTGDEAKAAKLAQSNEGMVIVQRGIVGIQKRAKQGTRIILAMRDEQKRITGGASILTSGHPTLSPSEVLAAKVKIDGEAQFNHLGIALNTPESAGGIKYLFDLYSAELPENTDVQQLGKDKVELATLAEARSAIHNRAMELNILQQFQAV